MWLRIALLGICTSTVPAHPVDLKGTVRDESGAPVVGATVLIFTAQPRKGVGLICPSCYLDCWRQASTDANGHFVIENVDGSLVFRIGAVTPVHDTVFAHKVDPTVGEAQITLRPRPPLPDAPRRIVHARVVDLAGKPVAHAVVSPQGYKSGESESFGNMPGIPSLTLTNDKGEFTLAGGKDVDALILQVSARGLTTTAFEEVATGVAEQVLPVGPGCAVRGRVVKDGKPVPGITVGIVQAERSAGRFVGERTAATNPEGRFVLVNIVPNDVAVVYSKMLDCGPYGSLPLKYVETTNHDTVVDLGDLAVSSTVRLTGRIVLPKGDPIPQNATLSIVRPQVFDSLIVPIAADGAFSADGLPSEPLTLSVGVPGYRLARTKGRVSRRESMTLVLGGDREILLHLERLAAAPAK
jgi:hypothetical protein